MARRTTDDEIAAHGAPEQLLLRSGRGDTEAFAELYDLLCARVFGVVTCLVRDPREAEAVTCEAFVEMWRRAPSYDPGSCSATAWALVVAHRLAVRARRLSQPATERPARPHCADDAQLVAAGLSRAQADAVQVAYFAGLDHHRIAGVVASETHGAALLADGLGLLATPHAPR